MAEPGTAERIALRPPGGTHARHHGVSFIEVLSREANAVGGIDLGTGNALGPPPVSFTRALRSIPAEHHRYADVRGDGELRDVIAASIYERFGLDVDPNDQVVITNGATGAMASSFLALFNKGDRVVVFQPFYEPYRDLLHRFGLIPEYVDLYPDNGWRYREHELRAAFQSKPAGLIVNSPNNPTGAIFNAADFELIAELCRENGTICLSDETYDEIYFSTERPASVLRSALWPDLSVRISSFSKTFSISGWRIGSVMSSPAMSTKILAAHEVLTGGIANPLQTAARSANALTNDYLPKMRSAYAVRRDYLYDRLIKIGFTGDRPAGGLFLTLRSPLPNAGDPFELALRILRE